MRHQDLNVDRHNRRQLNNSSRMNMNIGDLVFRVQAALPILLIDGVFDLPLDGVVDEFGIVL